MKAFTVTILILTSVLTGWAAPRTGTSSMLSQQAEGERRGGVWHSSLGVCAMQGDGGGGGGGGM